MSVNRNHWSAKEVEILLHYGAEVAVNKLGRSLGACIAKEKALKENSLKNKHFKKKKNIHWTIEDKVRVLTNGNAFIKEYYDIAPHHVEVQKSVFRKEYEALKSLDPKEYKKMTKLIKKAGGLIARYKREKTDRSETTARYNKMKDKLTFIHEERVNSAEELPNSEPAFLEVPDEAYGPKGMEQEDEWLLKTSEWQPKTNTPEKAQSVFGRIWEKVTNW